MPERKAPHQDRDKKCNHTISKLCDYDTKHERITQSRIRKLSDEVTILQQVLKMKGNQFLKTELEGTGV